MWPTRGPSGYRTRTVRGGPQRFTAWYITGYITPAIWGVPNASKQGDKIRCGASWLQNPCHFGGPQRLRAGDKISTAQQVGPGAT